MWGHINPTLIALNHWYFSEMNCWSLMPSPLKTIFGVNSWPNPPSPQPPPRRRPPTPLALSPGRWRRKRLRQALGRAGRDGSGAVRPLRRRRQERPGPRQPHGRARRLCAQRGALAGWLRKYFPSSVVQGLAAWAGRRTLHSSHPAVGVAHVFRVQREWGSDLRQRARPVHPAGMRNWRLCRFSCSKNFLKIVLWVNKLTNKCVNLEWKQIFSIKFTLILNRSDKI